MLNTDSGFISRPHTAEFVLGESDDMEHLEPYQPFLGDQAGIFPPASGAPSADGLISSYKSKGPISSAEPTDSTSQHGEQRQRRDVRSGLLWKFEIFSMFASIAALLAIIAILFAFDGNSMTHWHAALHPNTVVSALSTLSKASMMMVVGQCLGQLKWAYFERQPRPLMDFDIIDGASKGPMGSAQLLYRINRKSLAGSAGAVITLLALAMDPFVQQVISFDSRLVDVGNMTSSIAAARIYDMDSRREQSIDAAPHEVYSESQATLNLSGAQLIGCRQGQRHGNSGCYV
jgi:hypothetical protein